MNELPPQTTIAASASLGEPLRCSIFICPRCSTFVGTVRDQKVLYFWKDASQGAMEHALHTVESVKLKCGQCNGNIRWRPLAPHVPRGKQSALDTGKSAR